MRSFQMVVAAAAGVLAVLAGSSGQAFAAASPGPSGRQPAIGVFDENGKQIKDPARIAKVLAGQPTSRAQGVATSASGVDDYCPIWGGGVELNYDNVVVHGSYACQWLHEDDNSGWTFGRSVLRLTSLGDLEIRQSGTGKLKWDSNTLYSGAFLMRFQTDGNLVLYNRDMQAVWSSRTYGACGSRVPDKPIPILGLQEDSNMVIYCGGYRGNDFVIQPIWATNTIY